MGNKATRKVGAGPYRQLLRIEQQWEKKMNKRQTSKTAPSKEIELLARMWIECDPNRGPDDPGSGFHPDDIMHEAHSSLNGKPRWHWFIPRAEASLRYFQENGFDLTARH